jgi:hypothetical protein
MKPLRRVGGVAAIYCATAYVLAMVFFLVVLQSHRISTTEEALATLIANRWIVYVMYLIAYQVFGFALVVLTLAIRDVVSSDAPALASVATIIGAIWAGVLIASGMVYNVGLLSVAETHAVDPARAIASWSAISAVSEGLSGNGELVGGTWSLLISIAALKGRAIPRSLAYLGIAVGVIGIVSVVPALAETVAIFGLLQIVWFVWIGVALLRSSGEPEAK